MVTPQGSWEQVAATLEVVVKEVVVMALVVKVAAAMVVAAKEAVLRAGPAARVAVQGDRCTPDRGVDLTVAVA